MLCASNYSPTSRGDRSLGERLGERVWSRVREASLVIPVMGQDFRLRRAGGAA